MRSRTNQPAAYLIVYGLGENGRPRAARFPASDRATVEKAARQLHFQLVEATTEPLIKLAKQLPAGKIFATGRSLVPYVKQPLFERLTAANPAASAASATAADAKSQSQALAQPAETDAPVSAVTLKTTTLIGLSPAERQKLLSAWPSRDRKIPVFCDQLIGLWDAVWLPEISSQFADRSRIFSFADYERSGLPQFAPTLARCWQRRTAWGVHVIDDQWLLWTAVTSAKDSRSAALLFDITNTGDDRHPGLTDLKLGKIWRLASNRSYEAFATAPLPLAMNAAASSAEAAGLVPIARAAIAVARMLLAAAELPAANPD